MQESFKEATKSTSGFVAGELHVYMRRRVAPPQLSALSLSDAVDLNQNESPDYALSELARFGIVQSLPLASRLTALGNSPSLASSDYTVRLIVLSLLGDCAAEMLRAIERKGPFVVDQVEACTWDLLLGPSDAEAAAPPLGCSGALKLLHGTPHAQALASGLAAMASAPGLAPTLRPFHRRSKASAFFARRARRIADALHTTVAPEVVKRCMDQLRQAKTRVEGAAKANESAGLAFVLPEYAALGAGELPSRRAQLLRKGVRARSASAAVLWRFSSAGVAVFDGVDGGPAGGDDAVHVRAATALPSVDIVSGSAFAARAREAHLKHERALKWKHDLAGFRAVTQVGVNVDTLQMMVGRAQPVYTYIPGRAPAPPIAIAMGIAVDAGDPGSPDAAGPVLMGAPVSVDAAIAMGIAVDAGDPGSPDTMGQT